MKRWFAALGAGAVLAFAACGPVYNSETRYTPPTDNPGRDCVARCETTRVNCRANEDLKAENRRLRCESAARDDFERCLFTARDDQAKARCVRRTCSESADTAQCLDSYHVCFQSCGGVLDRKQVCVFGCPSQP